jgi:hypothetical protein
LIPSSWRFFEITLVIGVSDDSQFLILIGRTLDKMDFFDFEYLKFRLIIKGCAREEIFTAGKVLDREILYLH